MNFHKLATMIAPKVGEILANAGSKKSNMVNIDGQDFRIDRQDVVSRLSLVRQLGSLVGELDGLMPVLSKGWAHKTNGDNEAALQAFTIAAPRLVAAMCNENLQNLLVNCAKKCVWKDTTSLKFADLGDGSRLDEATNGDPENLLALGLCFLEVNADDFLSRVIATIQSRLKAIDVSTNTSSKATPTNEPQE